MKEEKSKYYTTIYSIIRKLKKNGHNSDVLKQLQKLYPDRKYSSILSKIEKLYDLMYSKKIIMSLIEMWPTKKEDVDAAFYRKAALLSKKDYENILKIFNEE